jgi:hypothetical protein
MERSSEARCAGSGGVAGHGSISGEYVCQTQHILCHRPCTRSQTVEAPTTRGL